MVRSRIGYIGQGDAAGHSFRVMDELVMQGRFYGMNSSDLAGSGPGTDQDARSDLAREAEGQHAIRRSASETRYRNRADAQPRAALPR